MLDAAVVRAIRELRLIPFEEGFFLDMGGGGGG
jgi:hypothetical protein